jgi:hypothetical protein
MRPREFVPRKLIASVDFVFEIVGAERAAEGTKPLMPQLSVGAYLLSLLRPDPPRSGALVRSCAHISVIVRISTAVSITR